MIIAVTSSNKTDKPAKRSTPSIFQKKKDKVRVFVDKISKNRRRNYMTTYRIHGDNIIECERIANIIIDTIKPKDLKTTLISPSTVAISIKGIYLNTKVDIKLELLPGFNKNTKKRWSGNIFDALKDAGSFFDETPDAIISVIEDNNKERIMLAIEFCSALQAGNQAWQRSARAFSTGRTGCPYIYIVDFVKYELDNLSRKRKNLRFPNAAVPYSYVNYSKNTGNFIVQLYIKSEEFDKTKDRAIENFDENDFGEKELGAFIVNLLLGLKTDLEKESMLRKNMNVVKFLAKNSETLSNYTPVEWQEIYNLNSKDILDYAVDKKRFNFHKTIASKSRHGQSEKFVNLIDKLSVGLASRDLPFGIIPSHKRRLFADNLAILYPQFPKNIIGFIGDNKKHLIVAIIKGFKPRGDDNRPDRGLLPLAVMLSSSNADILTYVYGPMLETNLKILDSNPLKLANQNGLWRSILSLSNYVLLDVPVLARSKYDAERLYETSLIKEHFEKLGSNNKILAKEVFPGIPINYGEDDVDTAIHYLFKRILKDFSFEGMCNPPGGDWSGFSIINGNYENRWLSLPRVSDVVEGKRPDHIIELFDVFDRPLLLSIESKEKSVDLETNVGNKLIAYIKALMNYIPSATRQVKPIVGKWEWGNKKVNIEDFEIISAAAYLKKYAEPSDIVFKKNCEMLFIMEPFIKGGNIGWEIEIITSTIKTIVLKNYIMNKYKNTGDNQFIFK